ncbi:Fe3+-hydroxamate ABC transporter periplasmic protein [Vibrio vulnificus]|uniref:TIGR04219 family outer membrane beta-barrel protein n=1 Tax=Vibrio vulnificus TaxID=672 RepID=UPI0007356290|nr:TIGR04219 family outer membrane beta-barrel protein [Vibrio vulnificus]EGR1424975.1 TIGR04219 family outer membrane beta-barrel protein [Vibrio vulnificus]MCU8260265.1 TIGR04219 family outer membrane beta-barrel protein [Vibrio vulnificus]MCU8421898.1 TIGR04219 family outer membrane beta-barrel protein [Vibrio vulnificus]MDS1846155.1 TIGR04219 family outer membrane beta-barrel protein [Vibrio vulnificus]PNM95871.1 iron-hydroxamate ABC transporter substrate-binding protein [Vibrio vulnificus
MRNKIATICALLAPLGLFSATCQASVETTVGAEFWNVKTKVNEVDRDRAATGSYYASIEHEVKYLPDMRVRYSSVDADYMAFDKLDLTLYFNLLEHDLMHFDAGITFSDLSNTKYLNVADLAEGESSFDEMIWAWYGYGEINVPKTNFDVIGEMNFGNNKGIKSTDLMAGMQYRLPFEGSEVALRAGYRVIDLEADAFASSLGKSFIFAHGWFLGAQYRF